MDLKLENKGVYELTRKKAFGSYYCNDKKEENDKVIVSYFESKHYECFKNIIKVIYDDYYGKDYVNICFDDSSVIPTDEFLEAILRGVCIQLNDTRTKLIKRSNNKKLTIKINYPENMGEQDNDYKRFREVLIGNEIFEELGYNKLRSEEIHSGYTTKYESEKIATEPEEMANSCFDKKLYEAYRDDYLSWDEYFLACAKLCSLRSKDPSTQVGACIVGEDNVILSLGYNGAPKGWEDKKFPWNRTGEYHDIKYPLVVHAEANAILHCVGAGKSLNNARIYVDLFPCNQCAQLIVQSGIKEVVYLSDKYAETDAVKASKRLFDNCEVNYRQINPEKEITLKLKL